MNKGICIGGPEQGRTVSMEGDLYKAAWPLDWSQRHDLDPTLPEDQDSQVFVYRFHVMAVADNQTFAVSARHHFWVPQDEGPEQADPGIPPGLPVQGRRDEVPG